MNLPHLRLIGIGMFIIVFGGAMAASYFMGKNAQKVVCLAEQKKAIENALSSREAIDKQNRTLDYGSIIDKLGERNELRENE